MNRSIPWFRNALLVGAVAATGLTTARAQSLPGTLSGAYTVNGTGTAFNGGNSTLSGTVTLSPGFFVDYLLVGGGGGGSGGSSGGGGGGGGVVAGSLQLNINSTSTLTTGSGGAGGNANAGAGGNSTFGGMTAYGGGAGGGNGTAASNGASGGGGLSGGGVPEGTYFASGTAIYGGQGFNGGRGYSVTTGSAAYPGGGGGGAGGAGQDATLNASGNGGIGRESFITGSSVYYGGGGGGGGQTRGTAGTGGLGGGGDGSILGNGSAGTNGLGGGGGGSGFDGSAKNGGAGGSGVVVLRYAGPDSATGGTESSYTADGRTYQVHQFTTVGNGSFVLAFDSNNFDAVLPGVLSGAGGLAWAGPGKLTLGGSNTFTGDTLLSAGILQLGHGQALGRSTFTGVSGTVSFGGLTAATFGGLSGNSNLALSNTSASAVALSVGANDQSTSYSGVLSGAGGLTKIGTGTLTLTGANTYSGGTTVSVGRLIGNATSLQGAIANSGVVEFNQTGAGTYSGVMSGTGGLVQSGAGTLTLTATNTYSGTTRVAGGGIIINGSIANSAVTVENGGLLGGSGTVGSLIVQSGGTVSPGNSPGTLNINGDIDWLGGGNYNWQIVSATGTAGTSWDLLSAAGQLDLAALTVSSKFNINLWTLGSGADGALADFNPNQSYTWTILTAGGGISGFAADKFNINTAGFANTLAPGWGFSVVENRGNLNLVYGATAIPEPGTWAAAALLVGGAAYARWRKRKA